MAAQGWSEPLWLETTPEDTGRGQAEAAVAQHVDVVLASGGDGTVTACAEGVAGSGVPLAVLLAGTGNLLARNLGLPLAQDQALGSRWTARTGGSTWAAPTGGRSWPWPGSASTRCCWAVPASH